MNTTLKTKIKDLLDSPEKWIKGRYRICRINPHTNDIESCAWCLVGAVCDCYDFGVDADVVIGKLQDAIVAYKGHEGLSYTARRSVYTFNDDPTTTFQDIRAVLELADV